MGSRYVIERGQAKYWEAQAIVCVTAEHVQKPIDTSTLFRTLRELEIKDLTKYLKIAHVLVQTFLNV